MILSLLIFIVLVFFYIFVPGLFIIQILRLNFGNVLRKIVISLGVGISIFLFSIYLLSWINLELLYFTFPLVSSAYLLKTSKSFRLNVLKEIPLPEISIIALGSLAMAYIMWRSGSIENGSLVFFGVNKADAIYHLSLIGNLKYHFPPSHPGLGGVALRGYNFFYDLMIAYFSKVARLSVLDLYFRCFPLFLAIFYGLSGWALGTFMKMKRATLLIFLFLLYFSQGLAKTVFGGNQSYDPGIVQPIANIVDPSVILSICLLSTLFILLFSKRNNRMILVTALILGILPMIKIYTGFLAFSGVGALLLIDLLRNKSVYFLKALVLGVIIAAVSYVPTNLGSGGLIFSPNLIYRHYLESISGENNLTWYGKLLVYEAHRNYIKIILYKFILLLPLFYLPSLGLRALNLLFVKKIFNKSLYSERNIFLGVIVLLGFLIPSFFIQSIAVFVIIQFLWITFFVLLIPTAYSLSRFFDAKNKFKTGILIVIIVLFSLPENLLLLKLYSTDPLRIDQNSWTAMENISSKLPSNESLILLGNNNTVPLFSALISRPVYYEPELMEFSDTSGIVNERKENLLTLESGLTSCNDPSGVSAQIKSISQESSSHYMLDLKKSSCFDKLKSVKLIYQNSDFYLYRLL